MRICRNCCTETRYMRCDLCGATTLRYNFMARDEAMPEEEPGCDDIWLRSKMQPDQIVEEKEPPSFASAPVAPLPLIPEDPRESLPFEEKVKSGYYSA